MQTFLATMTGLGLKRLRMMAFTVGLAVIPACGFGQQKPDAQAMVKETQRISQSQKKLVLVWWIPEQFWEASLDKNPGISADLRRQLMQILHTYTMVAVVEGTLGPAGGLTYPSEEAVRHSVTAQDPKGLTYQPVTFAATSPDMKNLLQTFKPIVANAIGNLGQNMQFLLFQSKDGLGIVDPEQAGTFTVVVAEETFKFRLPLGSLLPPKFDAETGEQFPGNYLFSPFTGGKLVAGPPAVTD